MRFGLELPNQGEYGDALLLADLAARTLEISDAPTHLTRTAAWHDVEALKGPPARGGAPQRSVEALDLTGPTAVLATGAMTRRRMRCLCARAADDDDARTGGAQRLKVPVPVLPQDGKAIVVE